MRTTSVLPFAWAALLVLARGAAAQGSIAGTVRDAGTSAPLID